MVKKRTRMKFIVTVGFLVLFIGANKITFAQEGAEVPTKGEIELFDETPAVKNVQHAANFSDKEQKVTGKFPSTGERFEKGILFAGLVLIIGVYLIYVVIKRFRRNDR